MLIFFLFLLVITHEHFSHSYFMTEFRLKLVLMSVPAFACMSIVSLKQILSSRQNQVTGE